MLITRESTLKDCVRQLTVYFSSRNNATLFPSKTPHDLRGKIIRVGLVITPIATCDQIGGGYAGTEIEMMEAIASVLNFRIVYNSSNELKRRTDSEYDDWTAAYGPWKTVLLRVLSGEVDIAMGGFNILSTRFDKVDYTQPYAKDNFRFYATNDMKSSHQIVGWIRSMVLQMVVVHGFASLTMYQLRPRKNRRKGDFGSTAIMVRKSNQTPW